MSSRAVMDVSGDAVVPPLPDSNPVDSISDGPTNRLSTAALWVLIGRGLGVGTMLVYTAAMPRLLSQQDFGEWTLILSFVGFAVFVAQVGLPAAAIRFIAEGLVHGNTARISRTLILSFRLLAVTATLTGIGLAWFIHTRGATKYHFDGVVWLAPLAAVVVILLSWQQFTAESLRGFHEIRYASLLGGGQFGGPLTVLIFLVLLAVLFVQGILTLSTALASLAASVSLTLSLGLIGLRQTQHRSDRLSLKATGEGHATVTLPELLSVCIPFLLVQLLAFVSLNFDIWQAGIYCSKEDVALYGAARRLIVILTLPTQFIVMAVIASIPDLHARGRIDELRTVIRRCATLAAVPALLVGLIYFLAAGPVLGIVNGPAYRAGAAALMILAVGQMIASCGGPGGYVLVMTGRQNAVLAINLVIALSVVAVCPWAAQRYGILGLAVTYSCAATVQNLAECVACRWLIGIWSCMDPRPGTWRWLATFIIDRIRFRR